MEDRSTLCVDCGTDTTPTHDCKGKWEYYMIHDDLWAKAGMEPLGGMLCIGCLERRLGRELTPADFTPYPINEIDVLDTTRLRNRKGRG